MRRVLFTIAFSILLLLHYSCSSGISNEDDGTNMINEITAILEGYSTKTGIIENSSGGKDVVWKNGNAVSLFFGTGTGGGSKFTTTDNGPIAAFSGTISAISGSLTGLGGNTYFWATYPYNNTVTCDGSSITTVLESYQYAYANDVANDLLVTVGRSVNPSIYFRNTYTLIEFTLTQENISRITFRGNNNESVAGQFIASMDANNVVTSTPTENAVNSIVITPGSTTTFATGTKYYFAFLPGTFSKGYTLTFRKTDGSEASYTRSSAFTFAIGTFYTMYNKDSGLTFSAPDPSPVFTAVDLGLSVKWATFNVGASSPEEYGDYFAWGEVEPYYSSQDPLTWKDGKTGYTWDSYKWCNGSEESLTKYNTSAWRGTVDNKTVLEAEDDVVHVKLGGSWRMPTVAEWTELRENCTWTWTTQNGVNGRLVTSNKNGNSIFLPAAGTRVGTVLNGAGSNGYYWSSSLFTDDPSTALDVNFNSSYVSWRNAIRYSGRSVRPVCE